MKVRTQTPAPGEAAAGVMELYISDHPLDCLTCPPTATASCRTWPGAVGLREVRYGHDGANHLEGAKDESNPYFTFDPSKCIVCSRCVRACEEHAGHLRADHHGRGFESKVAGRGQISWIPSACPAAPACRPARPPR
jgi:formate dehydrogenase major subunit